MSPNIQKVIEALNEPELAAFNSYARWINSARPKQIAPEGEYAIWLILAGRGWGKTKTGAEDCVAYALANPGTITAVVAPTLGDLRRTCIEGPSGILSCLPEECILGGSKAKGWNGQTNEIKLWNGSKIIGFSADTPDRMRGPQYHRAWCDELAAWRYDDAFDQLQFGLRLGDNPQMVITTTPRATRLVKSLVEREGKDVIVTSGSTFENTEHLAASALAMFKERYEGTRLGRQELYAEVLTDVEGALWTFDMMEKTRELPYELPDMERIVVGVDPAVTNNENSDETGIVCASRDQNGLCYVVEDASMKGSPDAWARAAIDCFYANDADVIVCETNQGGDLVTKLIRDLDPTVPVKGVRATRGKILRAEPIAAMYEQEKVKHLEFFEKLEDQMTSFNGRSGQSSPDRLDALVWALTDLNESSGAVYWRVS